LFKIAGFQDVLNILAELQETKLCQGIELPADLPNVDQGSAPNVKQCFSKTCEKIGRNIVCLPCKLLSNRLSKNQFPNTPKRTQVVPRLQKRNRNYKRRITRLVVKQKNIKVELMELRRSIKNLNASDLKQKLDSLQHLSLDHGTRLSLLEIVKKAKTTAKGNR